MRKIPSNAGSPGRQRGYSLVELSVAVLIGLFLVGGVLTILQDNRRTFGAQNQLSQLQDSERAAMTLITDVVQVGGYFPDPSVAGNTLIASLPAQPANTYTGVPGALAAGQAFTGTYNAAAPGDAITVRYRTANNDTILNCSGGTNATGGNFTYVNTFKVVNSQLVCIREDGNTYPLVSGIANLSVLYGVKTDFTVDDNNVDTYLNASQMTAANWSNVMTVKLLLTFNNPLYVAGGSQPQTIPFERVIGVMSTAGIKR